MPLIHSFRAYTVRKLRSTLNSWLRSNATTPSWKNSNTGPSLWTPSACPTSLQINQGIFTNYYILYPFIHTPTIYFLRPISNHTNILPYAITPLLFKINQIYLIQNIVSSLLNKLCPPITLINYSSRSLFLSLLSHVSLYFFLLYLLVDHSNIPIV